VIDAGKHQAEHVDLAFDEEHALLAADGVLGVVQVVEQSTLVKDRGLRRIEILWLAIPEHPAGKADGTAAQIVNREQQSATEAPGNAAVLAAVQ
jgi:hypothetical protein